ncbi:MAG TPA: nucleotidyl transferase AbiEii/AbiGii toxin family protein [Kofleriaceae bacterium]|nr:nucleotidyl transferase AbiEii/AbiGii toxin family protein [Kofleriaceae bacterium]
MLLSPRQTVELFHLVFVRALFSNAADKTLLAIKGGINLRFFFQSVRFSEDLDLDVAKMAKGTLENRVDKLLVSPAVTAPLRSRGITLKEVSKPKQTETVQRWKIALATAGGAFSEHTKLEFSRRGGTDDADLDPVDPAIAKAYALPSFLATHYRCAEAVRQKIGALAGRTQTQARDIFDLHVLFARPDAPEDLEEQEPGWFAKAVENAGHVSYEQYKSTVIAFLDPDHAALYSAEETWDAMQLGVIESIEKLR